MAETLWSSDIEVGHRITVEVESVFEEGMVVAFRGTDGTELKGALLQISHCKNCCQQSQQAFVVSPNIDLANPLTYLHDHPYPKLKRYAKHLSRNFPPDVLLTWNTPPVISTTATTTELTLPNNLHDITERFFSPDSGVAHPVVAEDYHAVAMISESHVHDEPTYNWPYTLPYNGSGRRAKFVAQIKLRSDIADMKVSDSKYIDSLGPDRKPKKQKYCRLNQGQKRTSFSPSSEFYTPRRKRKKTYEYIHDSGLSSDHEPPLLMEGSSPKTVVNRKYPVKEFSIPLKKVSAHSYTTNALHTSTTALAYTSNPSSPSSDTICNVQLQ